MNKKPTVLVIMDGYGLTEEGSFNAVSTANTPVLDALFAEFPNTTLSASGEDVGLPKKQIGNSEVGHTNIGAGRLVRQELPRITHDIESGQFFQNTVLVNAMDKLTTNKALHLIGLVSDGGVHSHNTHLYALLQMAKERGVENVYIHAFLDGRDVPPKSGYYYIKELERKCQEIGIGKIATVMGRFYAMDRDQRWDRIQRAYGAMIYGDAEFCTSPSLAVKRSYDNGVNDEFMVPVICSSDGMIRNDDSVIFFNFRPDRARELTIALTQADFDGFPRRGRPKLHFVCMTHYDDDFRRLPVAFHTENLHGTFGEYLAELGKTQLRIAETEKYAHVTFFFNGGREEPFEGEDRVLIPSSKEFDTYDLIPEMSAVAITDEAVRRIESGEYDVIIMNYANCDMVGHTGVFSAAVKAVETVDTCIGRIVKAVEAVEGYLLITADHGNAECMRDEHENPHTAHTTNLVPLILISDYEDIRLTTGRLSDLVPTMLDLMEIEKPPQMTGESLIW